MSLRYAATVLVVLVTASADVIALQLSADAMACCAKADYECAGIQTPDDCCQTMGHVVRVAAATAPKSELHPAGAALGVVVAVAVAVPNQSVHAATVESFKRPHDPPHLHLAPLLI